MPSNDVLARLDNLKAEIAARLDGIEQQLSLGRETFRFFDAALSLHRERVLGAWPAVQPPVVQWLSVIQGDNELRFPHRKILECLLRRYDYAKGEFEEVNASRLWKEARVGKGRLKGYLRLLMGKGYVAERDGGYRKHYRVVTRLSRKEP